MIPPVTTVYYFFSSLHSQSSFHDSQWQSVDTNSVEKRKFIDIYLDGKYKSIRIPDKLNFVKSKQDFIIDGKSDYSLLVQCQPRRVFVSMLANSRVSN